MMDAEVRFSAFVKPIRDLAQNWDVDIAHTLEDYLDELEDIRLPVVGHGNLNFAEAALLIQGSTTVYSRKVEYLHNLVFQALELISSNNETKEKNAGSVGCHIEDETFCWGDDPSYLILDDFVISTGINIDIFSKASPYDNLDKKVKGRLSVTSDVSKSSRASITLMNSILMDGSFANSSYASTSMKMSSCAVNYDGALVFANLTSQQNRSHSRDEVVAPPPTTEFIFQESGEADHWCGDQHDDFEPEDDITEQMKGKSQSGEPIGGNLYSASVMRDPLTLLDPYDPSTAGLSRQVKRIGRTYRIPQKSKSDRVLTRSEAILSSWANSAPGIGNISNYRGLKMLFASDSFADIVKRRKKATYSSLSLENVEERSAKENAEGDKWLRDTDTMDDPQGDEYSYENDINCDIMSEYDSCESDFAGVGQDRDEVSEEQLLSRRVEGALHDAGVLHGDLSIAGDTSHGHLSYVNTFENLCRQHIKNFMRGAEDYARETNLSKRVSEWTCRLEPILRDQEVRPEFDIHVYSDRALQKVAERSVTTSKGRESEDSLSSDVHFSDVVKGESCFEVGRIFLACLQLANLGNITFSQTNGSITDFDVELLSDSSNRLQIETYRAPSVDI